MCVYECVCEREGGKKKRWRKRKETERKRRKEILTGNLVTQVNIIRWLLSTEHINFIFPT